MPETHLTEKEFLANMQRLYSIGLFICGLMASTPVFSSEDFFDSFEFGYSYGLNYGSAFIEKNEYSNQYNRVTGLLLAASVFAENPISDVFRLSADLQVANIYEINETSSSATGTMASVGGILGRVKTRRAPYIAASIGYSYVDATSAGMERSIDSEQRCIAFIPFCAAPKPYRKGWHSKGLGYRIAIGTALEKKVRLELSHMRMGGSSKGLPGKTIGQMQTTKLGINFLF